MHAYIQINKFNKNQKEKKKWRWPCVLCCVNNCARYYAIPGTIGNPKEPTRLLSIRVSHEVRREVSQCQVALADPNRFQMMIINDTRSAGNAVHYRISDTVIIPIIRAGDKHEFHHRISFVPSDGWLITLSPTV